MAPQVLALWVTLGVGVLTVMVKSIVDLIMKGSDVRQQLLETLTDDNRNYRKELAELEVKHHALEEQHWALLKKSAEGPIVVGNPAEVARQLEALKIYEATVREPVQPPVPVAHYIELDVTQQETRNQ